MRLSMRRAAGLLHLRRSGPIRWWSRRSVVKAAPCVPPGSKQGTRNHRCTQVHADRTRPIASPRAVAQVRPRDPRCERACERRPICVHLCGSVVPDALLAAGRAGGRPRRVPSATRSRCGSTSAARRAPGPHSFRPRHAHAPDTSRHAFGPQHAEAVQAAAKPHAPIAAGRVPDRPPQRLARRVGRPCAISPVARDCMRDAAGGKPHAPNAPWGRPTTVRGPVRYGWVVKAAPSGTPGSKQGFGTTDHADARRWTKPMASARFYRFGCRIPAVNEPANAGHLCAYMCVCICGSRCLACCRACRGRQRRFPSATRSQVSVPSAARRAQDPTASGRGTTPCTRSSRHAFGPQRTRGCAVGGKTPCNCTGPNPASQYPARRLAGGETRRR